MGKIRVGIFFGGPSKEREISFAGGRTVYDNLDKSIFEAVPIFVDSFQNLILLDWQYIYKGSIRDFYPPVEALNTHSKFQIYIESLPNLSNAKLEDCIAKIGKSISYGELHAIMDIAFLALHGKFGEDGQIQALLDTMQIPYTGSGVLPSALGMDKTIQKSWMKMAGFPSPESFAINRLDWIANRNGIQYLEEIAVKIGKHFVIRPANQGSSIGVSILNQPNERSLIEAIDKAFFIKEIFANEWFSLSRHDQIQWVIENTDIRSGIGFPIRIGKNLIHHPDKLVAFLEQELKQNDSLVLEGIHSESRALVEAFIDGREFSCIVMRLEDGSALGLPPTEIIKGKEVYDYRSKYLPGLSRKLTPIDLPNEEVVRIQKECEKLFDLFHFNTYARIDGFYGSDGQIYLNDPNTTSGMLPSSFFFHQAAELGLSPSQLISYIIRQSVYERAIASDVINIHNDLIARIDQGLLDNRMEDKAKKRVAVILGGYSSERHISVESGRNIFEKLASSEQYIPIPIFLTGDPNLFDLYQIPINLLLKDNADDIKEKLLDFKVHPFIHKVQNDGRSIIDKYSNIDNVLEPQKIDLNSLKDRVDMAFIALHGRPGEDGALQRFLDIHGIPYNGSGPESSSITIDKYRTLQLLKSEGFVVAHQHLIQREDYALSADKVLDKVESQFDYPLIIKPVDDGCSSAVMMITSREQLNQYLEAIFRIGELDRDLRMKLGLNINEEFPQKNLALVEERIAHDGALHFMEITGGLLTRYENGELKYEIFEPSEALAGDAILSLEEKFLAGEGQNITPARFAIGNWSYEDVAEKVKSDLERAARILNVEGYARIDAFVRIFVDRVETIIIEVNSLPGMTPATCIFHQTAINGYKPYDFIDRILNFSEERNKQNALAN